MALGVNLVEKTITTDRTTKSCEHLFSLEPDQMKSFVKTIRDVEKAMGNQRRILYPEEKRNRQKVRRSTFLKRDLEKGEKIGLDHVEFRRPGFGISPKRFESLIGMAAAKALKQGHILDLGDLVSI